MKSENYWRLLRDDAATGARNMAVDEALLESVARGGASTLRFYSWQPHCLSLGRLQKTWPDSVNDSDRDFDVVRRPTGGRAVWHAHEITYSIAIPLARLPVEMRSVSCAYAHLSAGFARGLAALGLPVEAAPGGVRTQGPNCFAASAGCDFLIDGRKLIGAAQCRRDDALLQHGSLLLSINRAQWESRAGGPMQSATSLAELGLRVETSGDIETIIAALCEGFAGATNAKLENGILTANEATRAEELERGKYLCARWNESGVIGE